MKKRVKVSLTIRDNILVVTPVSQSLVEIVKRAQFLENAEQDVEVRLSGPMSKVLRSVVRLNWSEEQVVRSGYSLTKLIPLEDYLNLLDKQTGREIQKHYFD